MNKISILLTALLFCNALTYADSTDLAVKNIPDSLKKGANTVIRSEHQEITVISPTVMEIVKEYTVSILNKDGIDQATIYEEYDKLTTIENISGQLYDKDGKLVETIKKKDIIDIGYHDYATFYDDVRFKEYKFKQIDFPYTISYEVRKTRNTTFNFPFWIPQSAHNCSVEKADVLVKTMPSINVECYQQNCDRQVIYGSQDCYKTIKFSVTNLRATAENDAYSPSCKRNGPMLFFYSDRCEMQGFTGKTDTWKNFGSFIYQVNSNLDILPAAAIAEIHRLTDTCNSTRSKVQVLYQHMQHNTRYLQIYLGIGGWQAHPASNVAQKGYGDCKDLSNYMDACLKAAGILSYRALVFGGEYPLLAMQPSFSTPYCFNHMILCVPNGIDTIWLECTSPIHPAGYLGEFTADRDCLLLTPDGGIPVHTPQYSDKVNCLTRRAYIAVDEDNILHGKVYSTYSGEFWFHEQRYEKHTPETEAHFNKILALPTYKTDSYSVTNILKDGIPAIKQYSVFTGSGKLSRSAGRIFFTPKIFRDVLPPISSPKRTDSFQIYKSMSVVDTASYLFTGSNTAEQLPSDIKYDLPFASYHSQVSFEQGNLLRIVTEYTQKSGVYPPSMFAEFAKMIKDISNYHAYGEVVLAVKP